MEYSVINYLPYSLEEIKPGLIPERYFVPAAKGDNPGILHVSDAKSNPYVGHGRTLTITHSAEEVANAVVNDYCNSMLEASHDAGPALFCVLGHVTVNEIPPVKINEAKKRQAIWFSRLVRRADDDWSKYKQNRMITDIQRHAATQLGMVNKEWYHSPEPEEFIKCPACRAFVESTAAICHNCQYIINEGRAKELGLVKSETKIPIPIPIPKVGNV